MKSAADELLEKAMKAWDNGDKDRADYFCKQILEVYPESNAAQDAKEVLDGLPERSVTKPLTSPNTGSNSQTSNYTTARGVSYIIEFLGWALVVVGVFAMIYSATQNSGVMGVLIGIALTIGGLLQVMGAQIVRATVDNADHTGEMLAIMKSDR